MFQAPCVVAVADCFFLFYKVCLKNQTHDFISEKVISFPSKFSLLIKFN